MSPRRVQSPIAVQPEAGVFSRAFGLSGEWRLRDLPPHKGQLCAADCRRSPAVRRTLVQSSSINSKLAGPRLQPFPTAPRKAYSGVLGLAVVPESIQASRGVRAVGS